MTAALSTAAVQVLADATATDRTVALNSGTLDTKTYREVDRALTRIGGGGKWNRYARVHEFPRDPRPELGNVIADGQMPADQVKAMSFWRTPPALADHMIDRAVRGLTGRKLILEPSAGDGAICARIRATVTDVAVVAVEPDHDRYQQLRRSGTADAVHNCTLEEFIARETATGFTAALYDAVIANPPFTLPGNRTAYVEQIRAAWSLVRPGGRLVAVAPVSLAESRVEKVRALATDIGNAGGLMEQNATTAFAESGTNVRTLLVDVPGVAR